MKSKYVKTSLNRRSTYTYYFADGTSHVLKVGECGITAENIKRLHSFDDAEVYNNLKNSATPSTKSEAKPKQLRWHISLDAEVQVNGEAANTVYETLVYEEETVPPAVMKMREIVATMSPKQQRVYELLYIEGYKEYEIAEIMGVSTSRVTAIKKRIIEILKENYRRG